MGIESAPFITVSGANGDYECWNPRFQGTVDRAGVNGKYQRFEYAKPDVPKALGVIPLTTTKFYPMKYYYKQVNGENYFYLSSHIGFDDPRYNNDFVMQDGMYKVGGSELLRCNEIEFTPGNQWND